MQVSVGPFWAVGESAVCGPATEIGAHCPFRCGLLWAKGCPALVLGWELAAVLHGVGVLLGFFFIV